MRAKRKRHVRLDASASTQQALIGLSVALRRAFPSPLRWQVKVGNDRHPILHARNGREVHIEAVLVGTIAEIIYANEGFAGVPFAYEAG